MGLGATGDEGLLVESGSGGVHVGEIGAPGLDGQVVGDVGVGLCAQVPEAAPVGVPQGGVGQVVGGQGGGVFADAHHLAEDGIAALGIAGDGEHVAVVGGHQDQGLVQVGGVDGRLHGARQFDGVGEGGVGVACVVAVVDTPRLHHEEVTVRVVVEDANGLFRHLAQGGLAGDVVLAVGFVLHVGLVEQSQDLAHLVRVDGVEAGPVDDVDAVGVALAPLGGEVTAIGAVALNGAARVGGVVGRVLGQEVAPAAAHGHLDAIHLGGVGETGAQEVLIFDQLRGDVLATGVHCLLGHVRDIFPVAVR